jgi:hypothetical protein
VALSAYAAGACGCRLHATAATGCARRRSLQPVSRLQHAVPPLTSAPGGLKGTQSRHAPATRSHVLLVTGYSPVTSRVLLVSPITQSSHSP